MSYDIAHKSCIFDGKNFSNAKCGLIWDGIDWLKQKCDTIDKINKNIDISIYNEYDNKEIPKFPCVWICCPNNYIELYSSKYDELGKNISFNSYEEFYDYIYEHHTHLIKSHDIKIALKD